MNENVKKYLTYGGYIVLVIAVAAFVWLLFRDNRTAPDADHRAVQCIEQTADQQRKAEAEIAVVRKGIDSAQQSAAVIADSNGGGTSVADRIAEASQRVNNNIVSAEAANQSASSALERAFQLCRECRELNTSNQSIITTGQTRDAGGSESTRND